MKANIRFAMLATAALALASCSSSEPQPTPAEVNAGDVVDISNDNFVEPVNAASPTPTPTPTATETEAATPTPDETQQIQEDAEASGMTARVDRGEESNEQATQPAEAQEKK